MPDEVKVMGDAVSTHSRPKAAGIDEEGVSDVLVVSTHSRLKAAGNNCNKPIPPKTGFNTQPPEGGWVNRSLLQPEAICLI